MEKIIFIEGQLRRFYAGPASKHQCIYDTDPNYRNRWMSGWCDADQQISVQIKPVIEFLEDALKSLKDKQNQDASEDIKDAVENIKDAIRFLLEV